jgi:hypothetical protein
MMQDADTNVSTESSKNTRVDASARLPSDPYLPVVGSTVTDTDAWTEYLLPSRVKDSNLMDIFYRCFTLCFVYTKVSPRL